MGNTLEKKKRGFSLPHVYIVILVLMLIITAMTYIIPAGTYARDASGAVDPNNFTYIDQTPVGFLQFFTSLHQGIVESSNIIGSVLLISGCIQIINMTGAFSAGIQAMIQKTNGKAIVMVVVFFTLFTGLGVIGYLDALYPFYPIIISLFITLGYDKMVGTAVIMLSSAVGFTCGMVNPYTTGVAQTLVGLPMYSGIGFRAVGLVVFYIIALFFLLRYCIKIKKDAKNSIMGENYLEEQTAPMEFEKGLAFDGKRVILIVLFLATVLLTVVGSLQWAWGLPEIAAIYFPVTIIGVILFRINPSQACVEFGKGMAGTIAPTMVIGFSRAVSVLLAEGNITDTIIHSVSGVLQGQSPNHPAHHLPVRHRLQLLRGLRQRQGRGHDAHPPAPGPGAGHQPAGAGAGLPVRRRLHQHLLAHRRPAAALPVRHGLRPLVQVRLEGLRLPDRLRLCPHRHRQPDRLRTLLSLPYSTPQPGAAAFRRETPRNCWKIQ